MMPHIPICLRADAPVWHITSSLYSLFFTKTQLLRFRQNPYAQVDVGLPVKPCLAINGYSTNKDMARSAIDPGKLLR